ncbi:MAG: NADH-quinone oxidoreductase subunit J [Planctomycetota bacterium]
MANLLFYIMGLGAILGSLGVVCSKNPIASILSLLGTFFCLATIYLLAGFEFIAAAQILVYGGAIMVLFLFVVMLLNLGNDDGSVIPEVISKRRMPIAIGTSALLMLLTFIGVLGQTEVLAGPKEVVEMDTITGLAELLFGSFLLPFEAASVLLLAAAVAVIVLAKRERAPESKENA